MLSNFRKQIRIKKAISNQSVDLTTVSSAILNKSLRFENTYKQLKRKLMHKLSISDENASIE